MKSPTNYGSENEDAHFIRRVAAPDRPNNKRRQKKRLAIAGATLGLLAASAGVGYTAMKNAGSTSAVKTANLKADMSNDAKAFISKLGDAFHPEFERIDQDQDGKLSKDEIIADLTQKEMVDVNKVKASDLPEDIKKNVVALLEGKLRSDSDCAKQALDQRQVAVSRADHEIFYYLLDVFCPRPEDGKQTIAIPDEDGGYTTTEVRSIETPTGEQKILIPNAEGDITPVVVPEVPTEVTETTEGTQVVDVVTSTGETEQVIIVGEPEDGKQTVKSLTTKVATLKRRPSGQTTVEEVKAIETSSGETKLELPEVDTPLIVPEVPEEVVHEAEKTGETVQQTVDIVDEYGQTTTTEVRVEETSTGEQKIVVPTDEGYVAVDIPEPSGQTTVEEVKAIETSSGETKLELPEVDTPLIVPEVPEEVVHEAEKTGETVQVVDVVTPSGKTEQVIIEGEPEHGKQTVDIVDEYGQTTTTEVRVEETSTGEQKIVVPTDEGYVAVDIPEPVPAEEGHFGGNPYTEEQPVQQVVQVTTSSGEKEQVTLIGEAEHGVQKVEITDESGQTTVEEVKAIETSSGETKLELPEVDTPLIVPEVPEEVVHEAEKTGETVQQTVDIVDEYGQTTTTEVRVEETSTGEQKIVVPTDEGYVAVDIPEPVPAEEGHFGGNPYTEEQPVQQVVQVTTSSGEKEQVTLIGEAEHGVQKVEITDESGQTTVEEVKAIETSSGETKLELPEVDTPLIVPEVPEEVVHEAEKTGETVQQTVDIVDEYGQTTTTEVRVEETSTGEQKIVVPTDEGYVAVDIPEPVPAEEGHFGGNPYTEEQPVQQVVQWPDDVEEVKAIETSSGETKLELPEVDTPLIVPEVPEEVVHEAEKTGETVQVVDVVTPSGKTEQVIIEGEPEHGKQTVDIVDEYGQTTTTEVRVEETSTGEQKIVVPTDEGYVAVDIPEPVPAEEGHFGGNPYTEEQPVQQVVQVTTSSGEKEQVTLIGEAEHGVQKVEITDESGQTTVEEVKAIETSSGETKLELPEVDTPLIVPEVPEEVVHEAEKTGETVQQTVDIVDEYGQTTTTEVRVEETSTGEQKIVVPTDEGYVAVDIPEPVPAEEGHFGGNPYTEEQPVQQVVQVTTSSGEKEQVTLIGEAEHGVQKVEITDESGQTTVEEVKAIETSSGETKLELPEVDTPLIVPEVPEEVVHEAEKTGETVQQTVDIVDEYGQTTTTEVRVEETSTGEQKIVVPTDEGYVAVDIPEPVPAEEGHFGGNPYTEEQPVQQVVQVTTSSGEKEQVTLIGEAEHGVQKVEITDESGQTTVEEVKAIETSSGETKLELPEVDTPLIVPEVPEEVVHEAEKTGETVQQTVDIVDEYGQTTTTEVRVEETSTGEQKIVVPTDEGYVAVDIPEPVPAEEGHFGGNPYTEEQPVQQVVQWPDDVEEVKAIETSSGETKLELPEVDTPLIVPEVPEEVVHEAEKTGETVQVVDVVTPSGKTEQVIIEGEPEHGKQTVDIVDEYGQTTTTEVRVEETSTGEQKIVVPTDEGYVAVDIPEPVPAEEGHFGGNPYTEEQPVQQVVQVTTSSGEKEQVTLIGEAEHGVQKVEITDESGQTTVEEVKAIELHRAGVDVVTPSGKTEQVIIEGEPEHGKQTVDIVDEYGQTTTTEVRVEETSTGEQKIVVPTDEGYVAVDIPEPVRLRKVTSEATRSRRRSLVGLVIPNDEGGYTTKEVKAVETAEGEKLVIPDGEGGTTVVEVPDLPAEIVNTATEDRQVVNVVTPEGNQVQVVVEGEPEHGEQTVQIVDEHGDVTTKQVKVVETSEGEKLEIKTDEGYVAVEVPEVPEEIKEEIAEEQQASKFMTKDEFRDWIAKHYEDKLSQLKEEEQKLEEEVRAKLGRVKGLEDCIVQAANKVCVSGVGSECLLRILLSEKREIQHQEVTVLHISRPLEGGLEVPEDPSEIDVATLRKYTAILRSFPENELVFYQLGETISQVHKICVQEQVYERYKQTLPANLREEWEAAVEELIHAGSFDDVEEDYRLQRRHGGGVSHLLQIQQVVECYLMESLHAVIFPRIVVSCQEQDKKLQQVFCDKVHLGLSLHQLQHDSIGLHDRKLPSGYRVFPDARDHEDDCKDCADLALQGGNAGIRCSQIIEEAKCVRAAHRIRRDLMKAVENVELAQRDTGTETRQESLLTIVAESSDSVASDLRSMKRLSIIGEWSTSSEGTDAVEGTSIDASSIGALAVHPVGFVVGENRTSMNDTNIIQVSSGQRFFASVTEDGKLFTWGDSSGGRLGYAIADGDSRRVSTPQRVFALQQHTIIQVSCGAFHTLVTDLNGHVFAWGSNARGQLGFLSPGTPSTAVESPSVVRDLRGMQVDAVWTGWAMDMKSRLSSGERYVVRRIAAGKDHSLAISSDGAVFTWGRGDSGQLGHGCYMDVSEPKQVMAISAAISEKCGLIDIAGGNDFSIFLLQNGTAYICGRDPSLDIEKLHLSPSLLTLPSTLEGEFFGQIAAVSCGEAHYALLSKSGALLVSFSSLSQLSPDAGSATAECRKARGMGKRGR
ncbi:EF-Hand 1, calcium-binding site [Phytophthora cactorum]|nr:EF-Hand 1, calcium-binding site [Phytophthora cactorum]